MPIEVIEELLPSRVITKCGEQVQKRDVLARREMPHFLETALGDPEPLRKKPLSAHGPFAGTDLMSTRVGYEHEAAHDIATQSKGGE
jgi:hypothetical protein